MYNITNWVRVSLEVTSLAKNIKDNNDYKINNLNNNPMKNNNGFTLVEMIVTFLVLGILLAVSVMSLVAWQDWADFNRENEYAETLFLAAQNQLSEYSSNGTLSDFSERAYKEAYGNKVDLNSIYYAEGQTFTAELKQENSVWVSKNAGTLCYAMADKGDYKKYLAGEETESPTAAIAFELLESYVYDVSILNETICIEFSLEDGQVFSAFYTDKFTSKDETDYEAFEYNNSNEALRGLVNIATRYESYRKDRMVGYYGVDTLSAALVSKNDKPTISKISLNNEETLNLSFKLGKYASATNELTYDISVYDNETKKKVLDITLDTSAYHLKNYENRQTVPCNVIRYNYDASGNAAAEELGKLDILAYLDKDNQVRVVLDAADAAATTYLYNEEFDKLYDAANIKSGSAKFSKTLSFHRFGIDAEKIYCSLQGYSSKYKATSVKQSNVSDAYFANETVGKEIVEDLGEVDHFNYTVKNARHLYNVRYLEDMSEANLAKYKKTNEETAYITYALIKDIDWAEFVKGENYYATDKTGVKYDDYYKKHENINIMTDTSFASIGKLRMYDKFIGNEYKVSGININEKFNVISGLYGYDNDTINDIEKPVGLFNRNYGLIKTAMLDNIQVTSSSDKVGAFCGVNVAGALANGERTGVLTKLTVLNTGINTKSASVILGKEHVGGIVGYLQGVSEDDTTGEAFNEITLSELTNYAKVTGDKYVGGIIGEVRTSKTKPIKIVVDECINKGAVLASNSEVDSDGIVTVKSNTDPTKAKYIGGITGYTANVYANNHKDEDKVQELITLRNCVSSPVYSDSDLTALLDDSIDNAANVLSSKLNGVYVGGIVGYNYYSTIQSCTTKGEKGKQGYVFGYRYVGGIVGFNQGPASGIKGGNDSVSGINEANVVGCEYVGGITGCNADVDSVKVNEEAIAKGLDINGKNLNEILESSDIIVVPDTDKNPENKIENWVNKGVIFATGKYAGGISGYNCGWIFNCNSEVESAEIEGFFQSTYSNGDYTGGIAGYNNGIIGNTKREAAANGEYVISSGNKSADERKISAVCYISGKDYVGGIVGYNDVDAIVEDYELSGGYILGDRNNSSFVGGYAGFNASLRLLMDDNGNARAIISKPNRVIGKYFVGGSVGGNILNTNRTDNIPTEFKTDNFLGTIYGKAFVGGFVGYNLITNTSALSYNGENDLDVSYVIQQKIVDAFDESDKKSISDNEKLIEKVAILNGVKSGAIGNVNASAATMYISGSNEQMTQNSLGRIEADIYVGGVLGYNDDNTRIYIKNVENTTPIIADSAIAYDEQNGRNTDYAGRTHNFTYSYAGGIIGKASRDMTIDTCSNASSGTVSTLGTYTGGLVEVNEGLVINCKTNSFGKSSDDYVGGICGLNKLSGNITNCHAENVTISGRNIVSGIAAENFGNIVSSNVSKLRILVSGENVIDTESGESTIDGVSAAIAAYNEGFVGLNKEINVDISSKGNYTGAAVGINAANGYVTNTDMPSNVDVTDDKSVYDDKLVKITGVVEGLTSVGGLIGKNIGTNTSNIICGFSNNSVVTAKKGLAGGIIGDNASGNIIAFCDNYEVVTAANAGNAGGITSTNNSIITKCNNYAEIKASSGMCGGITALNNEGASVSYCLVEPKPGKTSLNFASKDAVGGISAINSGVIENNNLKNVNVYNYTTSKDSSIGVVVGINEKTGKVKFADSSINGKSIINCSARTYTDNSFVGGVAGTNKGSIKGADLNSASLPSTVIEAEVGFMPNSAAVASFGGVAGVNLGEISNLSVDGTVIGDLGSETIGYGGIAGINGYLTSREAADALKEAKKVNPDIDGYTAKISNCTFDGEVFGEGSGAGIAYIGGISGNNAYGGEIEHCYIGVIVDDTSSNEIQRVTKIYAGKQETTNSSGQTVMTVDPGIEYRNKGTAYEVKVINSSYDKMSYAYIGGVAGVNYGRVASCDNYAKSTEPVRVYSFISSSGGIVGYSFPDSYVTGTKEEHLTTGKDWKVLSRSTDNDRGNGGIIGFYKCTNDIDYCDNYADVECVFKANTSVSGIVGFINQSYDTKVKLTYCNNYGNMLGYTRTGGIVSHLSFSGIRFENCTNYGTVRGINEAAAGFVQAIWQGGYDVEFINCCNHGNILSPNENGAGFYARRIECKGDGALQRYVNCVNTGSIGRLRNNDKAPDYSQAASKNATGFSSDGSQAYFTNCRNYGNGNIYGLGSNGIHSKDSLDISQNVNTTNANQYIGTLAKQYSDKSKSTNNYYVLRDSSEPSANAKYGVYTSIVSNYHFIWASSGNNIYSVYEPADKNKRIRSSNKISGSPKMVIDFNMAYDESSSGADAIVVYFANIDNNTKNQVNEYSYTLYDASGNVLGDTVTGSVTVADNNSLDAGKVVLDFGAYKGKQVAKVRLETINKGSGSTTNNYSVFHGFGYIPSANASLVASLDEINNYVEKVTGTSVDFRTSGAIQISSDGDAKAVATGYENVLLGDYLNTPGADDNLRLSYQLTSWRSATGWLKFDFDFNYTDSAKGLGAICLYLNTQNGKASGNKHNYAYYAEFTDEDGNKFYVGSQSAPVVVNKATRHQEAEISVPAECTKKVTSVTVYFKCMERDWMNMAGFRWSEKGSSERLLIPFNSGSSKLNLFQNSVANELIYKKESDGTIKLYPNIFGLDDKETYGITMVNDIKSDTYYNDFSEYDPVFDTEAGKDTWAPNTKVAIYKELDPKYEEFLYSQTYDPYVKLPVSANFVVENKKGQYNLKWTRVNNATGYFTHFALIDESGRTVYTSEDTEALIAAETTGCFASYSAAKIDSLFKANGGTGDYKIEFYAKAVSAYHRLNAGAADENKYDSDYFTKTVDALQVLPLPEFHIENITGNKAVIVVDNFDEYQEFEDYRDAIEVVISAPKMFDGASEVVVSFASGRNYSEPFKITAGSSTENINIDAYARPTASYKNKYINSVYSYFAGAIMNSEEHANGKDGKLYAETSNFLGFYGTQMEELTYNIQIAAYNIDLYAVGDLVSYDEKLGVDVAYDRGNIHSASRNSGVTSYTTISLSGLPEDLLERDYEARSYLYASQNYILRYGHEVVSNVELSNVDDVKAITDDGYFNEDGIRASDLDSSPSIYDEANHKLKPGYVIYDNHDGTYDVYYSASLDADEQLAGNTGHYQVNRMPCEYKTDKFDTTGYNYYLDKNAKEQLIQPKPEIEDTLELGKDSNGCSTYTFKWDVGKSGANYDGANYSAILIGTTLSGEEVILTTPQVVDTNEITFTDTQNNWNYIRYTIKVTRLGTVDADNKSIILPSIASETCKSMLKLSQLPQPTVELHSTEDGSGTIEFDKDHQLYDVTWSSITDAYEKTDLGGYLIAIKVIEPKDENVVAKTHYYYVTDANALSHDDTIGLDLVALADGGNNIVINLKEDENSTYDADYSVANQHRAFIDLADFNGGDKLSIKIRAIARTNSVNYIDGPDSEAEEIILSERLDTPLIKNLSDDLAATTLTISEINNTGITFTYTDASKGSESGYYDIAIAVYDEEGKEAQQDDEAAKIGGTNKVLKSGDGANAAATGYWNFGALETLVKKSEKNKMSGNKLESATYSFKLGNGYTPSDYAGKWLKITLRARSDSKISSWWTDEDPDGATVNYYWVQIPKVKLDSPGLATTDDYIEKYYYVPSNNEWTNVEQDATLCHIQIRKKTFDFDVVDYADAFEIKYLGFDGKVQYIYLVPNDVAKSSFTVYGTISGDEDTQYLEADTSYILVNNRYMTGYGVVNSENNINIPYGATINPKAYVEDTSVSDRLFIPATICYSEGEIKLVLPDLIGSVVNDENEERTLEGNNNFTKQITVQALINEGNENSYVASPVNSWSRSSNVDAGSINNNMPVADIITDIKSGRTFSGLDNIDASLDKVVGSETKRYYNVTFSSSSKAVYCIRVMDESGAEPVLAGTCYLVADSEKTDIVSGEVTAYTGNMAILSDFLDNANYKLYISVANVSDQNGISDWSEEWYFSKTGIGDKVPVEP